MTEATIHLHPTRRDQLDARHELRAVCHTLLDEPDMARDAVELLARTVLSYLDAEDAIEPRRVESTSGVQLRLLPAANR